ncbi:uncharacterized protein EI90DRAFT_3114388 [Cantharellus anzutake]|uniref:uncharacterized protein n=1 Tax=Cantharellus anzutake TaxID=1750568 RepID=UPI001906FB58|nr:uncharacterized protein EI90DRAFT_3114388 [Cantharellus anzutake]KAF8343829.1 hypothetical protein EI90DRAFT_3114388 [Cantharellus anzutake]
MACHKLPYRSNSIDEQFKHYRLDGWDEAAYEREYEKELAQECGTCTFRRPVDDDEAISFARGSLDEVGSVSRCTPFEAERPAQVPSFRTLDPNVKVQLGRSRSHQGRRDTQSSQFSCPSPNTFHPLRRYSITTGEGLPSDHCGLPRRASDIALYPSATNEPKSPPISAK